jgi:hypothetical protein
MKFTGLKKIFKPKPWKLIPLEDIANSYTGLHRKLRILLNKPEFCQICGKEKTTDLHNISGEYKREISDWIFVCRKCHSHIHRPIGYRKNCLTNLNTKKNYQKLLVKSNK